MKGTSEYGLWYRQTDEVKLHGFTDVDLVQEAQQTERAHQGGSLILDL
jgi:hypothetical protein